MCSRPSLGVCLLLDAIGSISYFIPALGELSDVVWAPISGIIFFFFFRGKVGLLGGIFDFLEEALPFTDIIPSFTLAWIYRKLTDGKKIEVVKQ